jgi:hypothetical protein
MENLTSKRMAEVSQSLMPQGRRRRWMKSLVGGKAERIEVAGAVTSEHLRLGWKILYRKTMGVKFDGNIIIMC